MSTYYGFHCTECKERGGFLSRQAWGAGNFDIVDTFKFVMLHAMQCGPDSVLMHSEHDDDAYELPDTNGPGPQRLAFLNRAQDIFPRSNDWSLIASHEDFAEARREWQRRELREAEGQSE